MTTSLNFEVLNMFIKSTVFYRLNTTPINLPYHIYFFKNHQYLNVFWLQFTKLLVKQRGLVTLNLTKTHAHAALCGVSKLFCPTSKLKQPKLDNNLVSSFYVKPVQIFNLAFNKKTYNSFMWYLISILPHTYYSSSNSFVVKYSFLFVKENM